MTHWKRLWCWEGLGAREGDDRGWDGWMASLTRWTWVWVNSGSWWWTGRPGVLRFTGSQRVGHDWATDLIWSDTYYRNHEYTATVFTIIRYGLLTGHLLHCIHVWIISAYLVRHGLPTCQCRKHKRHRFHPWMGKILYRRAWQSTPVFLPGESHEQRSLVGYSP